MGTTMNMQWRGHVTSTAKIRIAHDFNWAIRTEKSTRQAEAVTGGRLQTCISEKYDINLPQVGFCQHGNGPSGFLTIRTFLDQWSNNFFQGKSYARKFVMNAVTTISTGFEQSLSINKDTQMTGNKNNINAPGI